MIPKDCKRLAEVDFPIAEVSRHAAREWPPARHARAGETEPRLQEPIKDPVRFEWHEVTKAAHYYLSVDGLTKPMQVREDSPPYGGERP
jgi:hypothetical protein